MMNFGFRKLTDEEFVQRIRGTTPIYRKVYLALCIVQGATLILVFGYGPTWFRSFLAWAPDATAYQRGFSIGLALGTAIAAMSVFMLWTFIHFLMMALGRYPFRIHRLLVKYYEAAPKGLDESGR